MYIIKYNKILSNLICIKYGIRLVKNLTENIEITRAKNCFENNHSLIKITLVSILSPHLLKLHSQMTYLSSNLSYLIFTLYI